MRKRKMIMCLVVVMMLSVLPSEAYAAKKVKLSSKRLTLKVGQKKTLKLKNNKKKVKWSVVSGKKFVKLSAKKKTRVTIKGKKKGTAKVQAKIGKKKYTCTVVVKKKGKSSSRNPWWKKPVKQSAKPTKLPTKKPVNTPSAQPKKKVASISYSGNKYAFLEKGKRLVDTGNTNTDWEHGEVEIGHALVGDVKVKYADGTTEAWGPYIASYDFSQINYEKIGVYDIILTYEGCTCKVPVVISEKKTEGLYTYLTDGNIAELVEMIGDKKTENEDSDYEYELSSTTLEIPETLGGAKVVQGVPEFQFSTTKIKRVKFPKFYQEDHINVRLRFQNDSYEEGFAQLEEFVVDSENEYYTVRDNVLLAENGTVLCVYPSGLKATSYQIPEGVVAFSINGPGYNKYLTEITFPKSYVGDTWYATGNLSRFNFPNLKKISVAKENPYWCSIDSVLYRKKRDNKLTLWSYPAQKTDKSFTVEENVSGIGEAGLDNEYLENITFKTAKTDIAAYALNGNGIKNIYCDFVDVSRSGGNFLDPIMFHGNLGDFSIYIKNKKMLEWITESLQSKVIYY